MCALQKHNLTNKINTESNSYTNSLQSLSIQNLQALFFGKINASKSNIVNTKRVMNKTTLKTGHKIKSYIQTSVHSRSMNKKQETTGKK